MRRYFGLGIAILSLGGVVATSAAAGEDFIRGADVSMLPEIERAGGIFRDGGKPTDALRILHDHGVNWFRVRLFVEPDLAYKATGGATQDRAYVEKLGRRIKAVGGKFLLDFHYSDTWADPGKQTKPRSWKDLDIAGLEQKVHEYTADVLTQLRAAGAAPDMVQIGNEIAAGMIWPEGKLGGNTPAQNRQQWQNFARLVRAGVRAVREVAGEPRPEVMIHIHGGGREGLPQWFFKNLAEQNVDFDLIGLSFYPDFDDTLLHLRTNMNDLARLHRKPIVVAEVAYPWRGTGGKATQVWPMTPAGQQRCFQDVFQAVAAVPDGLGRGVIVWYPESIAVPSLRIWQGGRMALFGETGEPLPALEVFRPTPR